MPHPLTPLAPPSGPGASGPGAWTIDHDLRLGGMAFGTRTTVLRRADGALLLYAPGALDADQQAAIDALGPVATILAPNLMHHLSLRAAKERWPQAEVVAPPGLREKVPGLPIDRVIGEAREGDLGGLRWRFIGGMPKLNELVLLQPETGTLIFGDLAFHFKDHPQWWLRTFMTLNGCYGRLAPSRLFQTMVQDRARLSEDVAAVLGWDFDRIALCHGQIVPSGAKALLPRADYGIGA